MQVDDESIERHLLSVVSPDKFGASEDSDDDFLISLAGAQEKDAYLWWNGAWHKPRGATPTVPGRTARSPRSEPVAAPLSREPCVVGRYVECPAARQRP